MNLLIVLWARIKTWWLMRHAVVEQTYSWATVAQLVYEYDQLDPEQQAAMLDWAKDPNNPNPNAIYFYRNITR